MRMDNVNALGSWDADSFNGNVGILLDWTVDTI